MQTDLLIRNVSAGDAKHLILIADLIVDQDSADSTPFAEEYVNTFYFIASSLLDRARANINDPDWETAEKAMQPIVEALARIDLS